jgi:hypothetical protein
MLLWEVGLVSSRINPKAFSRSRNPSRTIEFLESRVCPSPVVINFDDLPSRAVVTNQYPGVTFSSDPGFVNVTASDYKLGSSSPNYLISARSNGTLDGTHSTILDFTKPVNKLTFLQLGDNATGVVAQVRVFENGSLSSTVAILGDNNFLSRISLI